MKKKKSWFEPSWLTIPKAPKKSKNHGKMYLTL